MVTLIPPAMPREGTAEYEHASFVWKIQKAYPTSAGAIYALRDITLRVEEGGILAVVGQSGIGEIHPDEYSWLP